MFFLSCLLTFVCKDFWGIKQLRCSSLLLPSHPTLNSLVTTSRLGSCHGYMFIYLSIHAPLVFWLFHWVFTAAHLLPSSSPPSFNLFCAWPICRCYFGCCLMSSTLCSPPPASSLNSLLYHFSVWCWPPPQKVALHTCMFYSLYSCM